MNPHWCTKEQRNSIYRHIVRKLNLSDTEALPGSACTQQVRVQPVGIGFDSDGAILCVGDGRTKEVEKFYRESKSVHSNIRVNAGQHKFVFGMQDGVIITIYNPYYTGKEFYAEAYKQVASSSFSFRLRREKDSCKLKCEVTAAAKLDKASIVIGSKDGSVKKISWDGAHIHVEELRYAKHKSQINDLFVSGDQFATASGDRDAKLWNFRTSKLVQSFTERYPIETATFNREVFVLRIRHHQILECETKFYAIDSGRMKNSWIHGGPFLPPVRFLTDDILVSLWFFRLNANILSQTFVNFHQISTGKPIARFDMGYGNVSLSTQLDQQCVVSCSNKSVVVIPVQAILDKVKGLNKKK